MLQIAYIVSMCPSPRLSSLIASYIIIVPAVVAFLGFFCFGSWPILHPCPPFCDTLLFSRQIYISSIFIVTAYLSFNFFLPPYFAFGFSMIFFFLLIVGLSKFSLVSLFHYFIFFLLPLLLATPHWFRSHNPISHFLLMLKFLTYLNLGRNKLVSLITLTPQHKFLTFKL